MKSSKFLLAMLSLLLLAGCSEKYIFSHISGTIIDGDNGRPISAATITNATLNSSIVNNVTSDQQGEFEIEKEGESLITLPVSGVFPTKKTLHISHPDYLARSTTLTSLSIIEHVDVKIAMTNKANLSTQENQRIDNTNAFLRCSQERESQYECINDFVSNALNTAQKEQLKSVLANDRGVLYEAFIANGKVYIDNLMHIGNLHVEFDAQNKITNINEPVSR
ncbi:carboxypeptidase-like regulatory domain-containing protein [Gammaproteobacteria bacterium AS21]